MTTVLAVAILLLFCFVVGNAIGWLITIPARRKTAAIRRQTELNRVRHNGWLEGFHACSEVHCQVWHGASCGCADRKRASKGVAKTIYEGHPREAEES